MNNIPNEIKEKARLSLLYGDIIEQLKRIIAVDEGYINDEIQQIMLEAKREIDSLKAQYNELAEKYNELAKDAKSMAASLYIDNICDDLPETQRKAVISLLDGYEGKQTIDDKFELAVSLFNE